MELLVAKKKQEPSAFGRRLRAIRTAAGLTQLELSESTGIKQIVISRMEVSPTQNPTAATIVRLAVALDCTPNDLLGFGEEK